MLNTHKIKYNYFRKAKLAYKIISHQGRYIKFTKKCVCLFISVKSLFDWNILNEFRLFKRK